MAAEVLTDKTQVKCAHGAMAKVSSSDSKVKDENGAVLVSSDIHTVSGCTFMRGQQPSPCVQIKWQSPATKVSAGGTKVLTMNSVGIGYAADNSPQGPATKSGSKKTKAT